MCRSIGLLALLVVVSHPWLKHAAAPSQLDVITRPVKQVAVETRSSADIDFTGFEFHQLWFTNHPGHHELKGEPTKGFKYSVRARLNAEEAISTAKFEAIDRAGNVIQKILIQRQASPSGYSEFYGVMKVPDRPFRVVINGEGTDGKSYRVIFKRLFKPTLRRKPPILIPSSQSVPAAEAKRMRKLLEETLLSTIDEKEDELRRHGAETIVMPRTRVLNVMYAPYLSKVGRPLGLRITFDVEFSQDGYYNPELKLYLDYQKREWRGWIEMYPLTGSIEPQPAETGSPQNQPHILAYGAGYLYRAGTTYHFTAELIPEYVIQNTEKTLCIEFQKYKYDPARQVAFTEILASKVPTKYSVHIANTAFYGEIEGLHSQSTLLESYMAEGAQDCGEQPAHRQ